jgi:hypothetical protein
VRHAGQLIKFLVQEKPDAGENQRVVLSVDDVIFPPMITVSAYGIVDGLKHLFKINHNLFNSFIQKPQPFVSFLKKEWNQTHSAFLCPNFNDQLHR